MVSEVAEGEFPFAPPFSDNEKSSVLHGTQYIVLLHVLLVRLWDLKISI